MEIKLQIQGRPIVKKNSRRVFTRSDRLYFAPSEAYEKYKQVALRQIMEQFRGETMKAAVNIAISFEIKGKYRVDLDNLVSSIIDILEEAKVIENDNLVVAILAAKSNNHQNWLTNITVCYDDE